LGKEASAGLGGVWEGGVRKEKKEVGATAVEGSGKKPKKYAWQGTNTIRCGGASLKEQKNMRRSQHKRWGGADSRELGQDELRGG